MSAYGHRDRPPADSHRRRDSYDDRDRGSRGHAHSSRSGEPRPSSLREAPREVPATREPASRPVVAVPAAADLPPPPSMPPPPVKRAEPEIDRTKVCPLLLRVFHKLGGHHRLEEFARVRSDEQDDEVQIYTWPDATLRELSDLVKEVQPAARMQNSRMGFALVYPDRRGHNVMRVVGQVHSSRVGEDDVKTLKSLKFQTGDYMDVAVF